ncbi:DUF6418 domain-containing protein [Ectopseudomonas mendocina]|uniref:DUF6418 domain-containing protein n=1 Tax=Ectopseudomonas mendocina TaxID=300 RepID=A0ABZ2RSN8_ECTME
MTAIRYQVDRIIIPYLFDALFFLLVFFKLLDGGQGWIDFLSFLLFLCWSGYELLVRTRVFYLNIHTYLFGTLFLLGVLSIEYSDAFYMYEIDELSGWHGTFFGALACMYAYARGTSIVLDGVSRSDSAIIRGGGGWFNFLVVIYLVVSLFVIAYHRPALVLQVDRFIYDKVVLGVWGNFTNLGYYFCLGLGAIFFGRKSYFSFFLFLMIIFVFLLKGHKFSNLVEAFFLFAVPYFCMASVKVLRRKIASVILGISLLFGMAVSINLYLFPAFSAKDYLRHRLFQEGQLWWAVAKNPDNDRLHMDELRFEISSYFSSELMERNFLEIGMYKVMRLAAPEELVEQKIERQSRYTRSAQALLYYYFNGFIACVFMLVFGFLWGWLLRRMYHASLSFWLFESIILCRVFYIFMKAFKDADFYKIFSFEMLILGLAILLAAKFRMRIPKFSLSSSKKYLDANV